MHVDSPSCKLRPLQCFVTLSHPCAELHHYCWAILPWGSGHLGSSCILALYSVNHLQEDWLSDFKLCSCFVLNRGVFGKQGYQCQGKVLCSCTVCVGCAVSGPCSCAAGTSCGYKLLWSHRLSSSPASQNCAFEQLSGWQLACTQEPPPTRKHLGVRLLCFTHSFPPVQIHWVAEYMQYPARLERSRVPSGQCSAGIGTQSVLLEWPPSSFLHLCSSTKWN